MTLKASFSALLLGALLISGCASTQASYQIRLNVSDHIPHCGGAFPSPDQMKGVDEAVTGEVFGLISGKTFSDSMQEPILLRLDEKGSCSLDLQPGTYSLVLLDKWMESASFMKKYSEYDAQLYKVKDAACFEKWRTTVDYIFEVNRDSIFTYIRQNNCYTGAHPCLEYIGPKAP